MKKRTRSRELALQFLYQVDLRGSDLVLEADKFLRGEERDAGTREFALHLVRGTHDAREAIDAVIRSVAQNWDIERMAVIDRNVLRMATFELLHCADIPPKVSINEAIELGKRFSTQNSGGFINGILDKIKDQHVDGLGGPIRQEATPAGAPPEQEPATPAPAADSSPVEPVSEPEVRTTDA